MNQIQFHTTTRRSNLKSVLASVLAIVATLLLACLTMPVRPSHADEPTDSSGEEPKVESADAVAMEIGSESVATFAGGCFWCTEAVFERVDGVQDVVSGYIGGHIPNPTYALVKSKRTGHAEAVEIYFDPEVVSYEELLKIFFKTHDPTTVNKQGIDEGPQYRSVVFARDEEQKEAAEAFIEKLTRDQAYNRPIVTEVLPATVFYVAEEYHQDYFRRNPRASYCRRVVVSKVRKLKKEFPEHLNDGK